ASLLPARGTVFVRRGQRALLARLLACDRATADDVRGAVELPTGIDPRCLGTVPGPLADAGLIRRISYTASCRPERHASIIAVWTLADRASPLAWLADNPELPDPAPAGEDRQLTLWD